MNKNEQTSKNKKTSCIRQKKSFKNITVLIFSKPLVGPSYPHREPEIKISEGKAFRPKPHSNEFIV